MYIVLILSLIIMIGSYYQTLLPLFSLRRLYSDSLSAPFKPWRMRREGN